MARIFDDFWGCVSGAYRGTYRLRKPKKCEKDAKSAAARRVMNEKAIFLAEKTYFPLGNTLVLPLRENPLLISKIFAFRFIILIQCFLKISRKNRFCTAKFYGRSPPVLYSKFFTSATGSPMTLSSSPSITVTSASVLSSWKPYAPALSNGWY